MNELNKLLRLIHTHHAYHALMEELEKSCPAVPEYRPGQEPLDWAYRSGLKTGYLAALDIFGVTLD